MGPDRIDVLALLAMALSAHGLKTVPGPGYVEVEGMLHLSGQVYDKPKAGHLAIVVLEMRAALCLGGTQWFDVVQRFGGLGETRLGAVHDAFGKFLLGSLHVLLAPLGVACCEEEPFEVELWEGQDVAWKVLSGPVLTQGNDESLVNGYPAFADALKLLFVERARAGPHSITVFLSCFNGELGGSEVFLDDVPWDEAHHLLRSRVWSLADPYQSIRQLWLVLPVP